MGGVDRKLGGEVVKAAGGLLWRAGPGGPRLAVIHRPKHDDWSLPKGKLKRGEEFTTAALREVAEETGCQARLGAYAGSTLYTVKGRLKLVLFWHMTAEAVGPFEPNDEVDRLAWLSPEQALARLDNASERRLVRRAAQLKSPMATRRRTGVALRSF